MQPYLELRTPKQNQEQKSISNIVAKVRYYRNLQNGPGTFIMRLVDYSKMRVRNNAMKDTQTRKLSFLDSPISSQLAQDYANTGLYRSPEGQILCIFCQGEFKYKDTGNKPKIAHKKQYPTCPFILNLNCDNTPPTSRTNKQPDTNQDIEYDEVIKTKIIFPLDDTIERNLYQSTNTINRRKSTFKENENLRYLAWQGLYLITKEGEYYLKCNSCLKETYLLEDIDKRYPRGLHLPECNYSISEIPNTQVRKCRVEYNATKVQHEMYQENRITTSVIKSHPENRENILKYVEYQTKTQRNWSPDFYELLDNLNFISPKEELQSEDNVPQELYLDNNECVICISSVVQVIFLPCGHLKVCKSCSREVTNCPVCRMVIERRITNFQL